MGGNSRYDKDLPVDSQEADEARALHTIGELVRARGVAGLDVGLRGQVAEVLDSAAIELNAGRAIPIGLRRAVTGMADGLRAAMDPRNRPSAPAPNGRPRSGASTVSPPTFRPASS